jgi:hypothetical protein
MATLEELREQLKARVPRGEDRVGCALCEFILRDLETNGGKLRGCILDSFDKPMFSRESELIHLKLEKISFEGVVL